MHERLLVTLIILHMQAEDYSSGSSSRHVLTVVITTVTSEREHLRTIRYIGIYSVC
jgi:hypothetical protein